MTKQEGWFVALLILNLIVTLVYLLCGCILRSNQEGKTHYFLKAGVMLLCPLAGAAFFFIGYVNYRFVMHRQADLSDVAFSKERTRSLVHADEEREKNMVPLEEALAITDKDNLRSYMLNVLRGNVQDSLAAISMALNSEDSETSHYAASVLRDELNTFRMRIQKIYAEIKKEPEQTEADLFADVPQEEGVSAASEEEKPKYDAEQIKYCHLFLDYMDPVLSQKVFTDVEQASFAEMLDEVTEILYTYAKDQMRPEYYSRACLRLMECKLFARARIWGERGIAEYDGELSSYTCLLKLYFTMHEREPFFAVMERLKKSNIVVDSETLDLIRVFSE